MIRFLFKTLLTKFYMWRFRHHNIVVDLLSNDAHDVYYVQTGKDESHIRMFELARAETIQLFDQLQKHDFNEKLPLEFPNGTITLQPWCAQNLRKVMHNQMKMSAKNFKYPQ